MDRRKFIKVGVPVVVASTTSGRLYGKPASLMTNEELEEQESLGNLVKYRLSNLKISPKNWQHLIDLNKTWSQVCSDHSESEQFLSSPGTYLANLGISKKQQTTLAPELKALSVFTDRDIAASAINGNPEDFFRVLSEKKLISSINNESELREKLDAHFTNMFSLLDSDQSEKDSLYELYNELGLLDEDRNFKVVPGNQVVPVAAVAIVVIAVSVVIYATVGVGAGVGILVAVAVSISIAAAVYVGGGGGHVKNIETPSIMEDMSLAAQVSGFFGNEKLTKSILSDIENVKGNVGQELDKVIDLALKHKLISFEDINEDKVRASLHTLIKNQIMQIA